MSQLGTMQQKDGTTEQQGMSEAGSVQGGESRTVTLDEVRRVAELANLRLTAEEEPAIERDLNAILGYIAQLNELDTAGVTAMAQVAEVIGTAHLPCGEALRTDAVRPSLERASVMRSAPETDGRFFKVPKVIER